MWEFIGGILINSALDEIIFQKFYATQRLRDVRTHQFLQNDDW